ncbi:MAG: hypothetical protein QM478_11630 [Flavobacteriaceae bacterium]
MKKISQHQQELNNFDEITNSFELELLHRIIVELMIEYNQEYTEFDLRVSDYYIRYLKQRFGKNISLIRSKTGFTKNKINKCLKNELIKKTDIIKKQKTLLVEAYNLINKYCLDNDSNKMPKILLYSMMQTFTDGHVSIKAHLDRLIETGFIDCKDGYVYIDLDSERKKRDQDDYLRFVIEGFNRLFKTVNYNKNKDSNKVQLFERRLRSTQIPPKYSEKVTLEINKILGDCYKQVSDLLSSYEVNVQINTYKEITVHFIHFNQFLIEEISHENIK